MEKEKSYFINEKGEKIPRVPCEIYSRSVGYYRPINQWNEGKRAEFEERKTFDVGKIAQKVS